MHILPALFSRTPLLREQSAAGPIWTWLSPAGVSTETEDSGWWAWKSVRLMAAETKPCRQVPLHIEPAACSSGVACFLSPVSVCLPCVGAAREPTVIFLSPRPGKCVVGWFSLNRSLSVDVSGVQGFVTPNSETSTGLFLSVLDHSYSLSFPAE